MKIHPCAKNHPEDLEDIKELNLLRQKVKSTLAAYKQAVQNRSVVFERIEARKAKRKTEAETAKQEMDVEFLLRKGLSIDEICSKTGKSPPVVRKSVRTVVKWLNYKLERKIVDLSPEEETILKNHSSSFLTK